MNKTNSKKEITIDANGKTIGRVATEVAVVLRGKDQPSFERHLDPAVAVTVINAGKLKIEPKKLTDKKYHRYSGYPGGLKTISLEQMIAKKGIVEPLRQAIRGMLPKNKLRPKLLNNLIINE